MDHRMENTEEERPEKNDAKDSIEQRYFIQSRLEGQKIKTGAAPVFSQSLYFHNNWDDHRFTFRFFIKELVQSLVKRRFRSCPKIQIFIV